MTTPEGETRESVALEELEFIARSQHRIQLLSELSLEARSRRELHDVTEISQPTLGRILGDFERREWVSNNHNGTYRLTPLGALIAGSVDDLLDAIDVATELSGLADQLPLDRFDFDLSHLSNARITTPSADEPLAHMRRFDELAENATSVDMFSNVLLCSPANGAASADKELLGHVDELIVTDSALKTETDEAELRAWLSNRIAHGDFDLYRLDGDAEFLIGIFDETVGIVPIDDTGMPSGLIESETEQVRTWIVERFEEYRRVATRLGPDDVLS